MHFHHISVMPVEVIEALDPKPGGIFVDCTIGGGGHSLEIVKRIGPGGRLIGIDQDKEALKAAGEKLKDYKKNVTLVNSNFVKIKEILEGLGIQKVDGILFDLGVSSYQLDEGERGFSYRLDAPLDMRMNPDEGVSAKELVNKLSQEELAKIIWEYGEERWAKRIAEFIVSERSKKPIETTGELVTVIKKAIPVGARKSGPHPAKRTFQALRIAVNDELNRFAAALKDAVEMLATGGRVVIISFHSLEDRITKETLKELAWGCTCPPKLPVCTCDKKKVIEIITKKPVLPAKEEIENNPRARSARLRAARKL